MRPVAFALYKRGEVADNQAFQVHAKNMAILFHGKIRVWLVVAVVLFPVAEPIAAQQTQSDVDRRESAPTVPAAPDGASSSEKKTEGIIQPGPPPLRSDAHRFWDRENDWLFAAVGAGRALDYASTLNLRHRGINEVFLTNSIVDNHALFAGIEAAGAAASIGLSYAFHRAGHHQLERWTSIIHFGVATGGAIRNYALPTPH
jgi:hypothetical protein